MKTVISASRRTDLPALYLPWLLACLKKGSADVLSPRWKTVHVDLSRERIHTLVLWSKDFGPFLRSRNDFEGYHLYFHFTVNDCPPFEPGIPALEERLRQAAVLARIYGPERVHWRFDPILFWDGGRQNNLARFSFIADQMARSGIRRCTFSFCTYYRKVTARLARAGFDGFDPPADQKIEIAARLAATAGERGITLFCCGQDDFLDLPNVRPARCIDGALLERLAGEPASKAKDASQRASCHCTRSVEIGSYALRCAHGCRYCYANPCLGLVAGN